METKIGHQIQKLRKSKNMSQEKLAEKLGVSRHSISNWEREVSNPDLKTISGLISFMLRKIKMLFFIYYFVGREYRV